MDGVALQVTKPARNTGLVGKTAEDEATYLALPVYVFNNVLLIVDREEPSDREVADPSCGPGEGHQIDLLGVGAKAACGQRLQGATAGYTSNHAEHVHLWVNHAVGDRAVIGFHEHRVATDYDRKK